MPKTPYCYSILRSHMRTSSPSDPWVDNHVQCYWRYDTSAIFHSICVFILLWCLIVLGWSYENCSLVTCSWVSYIYSASHRLTHTNTTPDLYYMYRVYRNWTSTGYKTWLSIFLLAVISDSVYSYIRKLLRNWTALRLQNRGHGAYNTWDFPCSLSKITSH
jgi:hypothetical protein